MRGSFSPTTLPVWQICTASAIIKTSNMIHACNETRNIITQSLANRCARVEWRQRRQWGCASHKIQHIDSVSWICCTMALVVHALKWCLFVLQHHEHPLSTFNTAIVCFKSQLISMFLNLVGKLFSAWEWRVNYITLVAWWLAIHARGEWWHGVTAHLQRERTGQGRRLLRQKQELTGTCVLCVRLSLQRALSSETLGFTRMTHECCMIFVDDVWFGRECAISFYFYAMF